jgi:cytochrome c biogenesis protein CcdA
MMIHAVISHWGLAGAFGLGVLAALHPCPLSTLAGAFLLVFSPAFGRANLTGRMHRNGARQMESRLQVWVKNVLRAGTLALGMAVALGVAAAAIGHGLLQVPFASTILQDLVRPFFAPFLIVAGILQTGLFASHSGNRISASVEKWLKTGRHTLPRMFLLGMALALAFCPATAALFFGVLIPLSVTHGHPALYAFGYGLGFGIPLLFVTGSLAAGVRFKGIRSRADTWSALSGWGLIALGAWLTWSLL